MEKIWTWIARANARLAFIAALLALIAVGAWQVWHELHPEQPFLPQVAPHPGDPPPSRLPLLDLVATRQALHRHQDADPFGTTTPFALRRTPRPPPEEVVRPPRPSPPAPTTPAPAPAPTVTPAAPRPPPPRTVRLRYRGMMIRPDGVPLALIENSETQTDRFYAVADRIDGMKIIDIGIDHVRIGLEDETLVPIERGEGAEFTGIVTDNGAVNWTYRAPPEDAP